MSNVSKHLKRSGEAGFTLLEMMIAAAVLAIALTGVVATMFESTRIDQNTKEYTTAQKAAEDMMAQITAQPRDKNGDDLVLYMDNHTPFDVEDLEEGNTTEGSIVYDDSNPGYVIVDVTVAWNGTMGDQELTLTRYLYVHK